MKSMVNQARSASCDCKQLECGSSSGSVLPNASLSKGVPVERMENGDVSTSNLTEFLNHTTPRVALQYLPKTCLWDNSIKRLRHSDHDMTPFFTLSDLWDTFDEWSAYGAGVPLMLNGKEAVVQYYVPYLSGIQLYTRSGLRLCRNLRKHGDESDASECSDYRDSASDASSDNEIDERANPFWRHCMNGFCNARLNSKDFEATLTSVPEFSSDEEDNWGQKEESHLFMEYFENLAPYSRVPLVDKIVELTRKIPELRTLRSFELLPTSWFSIAWYPIYRIPTGPTLKDLATCFLTYHSLSTPLQDLRHQSAILDLVGSSIRPETRSGKLLLQSFGLASYKLRGAFWTAVGSSEKQLASNLEAHADSWLKSLQVQHPDFEFFASRSPQRH